VKDAEGTNSAYRASIWSLVEGAAVTDGVTWSTSASARPCFVVHTNHSVTIENLTRPPADAWEVIGGNTILVKGGKAVPQTNKVRHPRTVVGFNADRTKLMLLVVDGRKKGVAIGMSYDELAQEMLRLGCTEALNLDGGGSSVMAVREAGGFHILNEPTDGRERAVANVLGVGRENAATAMRGEN
jgi:exopolysaccharide biosynthesis protein